MTLPPGIGTCIVTGHYEDAQGRGAAGSVVFSLAIPLIDATEHVIIIPGQYAATLVDGAFAIALPFTDNAAAAPTGFSYQVMEQVEGGRTYFIQLPTSTGPTVDISTLVPASGGSTPVWANAPFGLLAGDNTWTGHNAFALSPTGPDPTTDSQLATRRFVLQQAGAVTSVNGHTGTVVLNAADVAAIPTAAAGAASGVATLDSGSHLTPAQLPPSVLTSSSVAGGDASGTLAALSVDKLKGVAISGTPSAGKVLTATGPAAADWETPAAASPPTVRQAYVTAGAVTFNSDPTFTRYPAVELAIPAAVGDWVELSVGGMWQPAGSDYIDWAVVSGSTMVRFSSSGTGTPCVQGDPGWYPSAGFAKAGGTFGFTVTPGDLDAGTVRFTLAHQGAAGGTLYSNANYPVRLRALNLHAVT